MVWTKGQLEVTKILDLGIDRRRVLPPDTLHGQLLFPTFWSHLSYGYREDIAIISPGWCSCHLYRVALLAVSPFELAPVQLLPCCSPFDLAVTFMHSLFSRCLMPAVCIHLPRRAVLGVERTKPLRETE